KNIEAAGMTSRVTVVVGRALTVLDSMIEETVEPFDFVFIDADKESNVDYLDRAVTLGKAGSMLYVDNVVRDGAVLDETSDRGDVMGTRALFDALHRHPRLTSTAVQTVGTKGYDGFVVALITG
ncbi:MAG: methyltransferase, partial [Actinomycetes bacterium]